MSESKRANEVSSEEEEIFLLPAAEALIGELPVLPRNGTWRSYTTADGLVGSG